MRRSAAVLSLAAAAITAACSVGGGLSVEPLPDPPPTSSTTSRMPAPDRRGVELPAVRGSTTTIAVAIGPGDAHLEGTVVGPGGPVPGATVRVERLVGDAVVSTDVSSPDGRWVLPGVSGGRYRIRAWRAPDMAQVEPAQIFLGARDTTPVELKVERFAGPHAAPALAPSPAVVGQPATLAVQLTQRSVDETGIVRAVPLPATRVDLSAASSAWLVRSASATVTDASGRARWDLSCRAPGPQPLAVVVNATTVLPVTVPPCAEPQAVPSA